MQFIRTSAISLWSLLDPLYYLFTRLNYLEMNQNSKGIFRVRLTKFKGRPIMLEDGTRINKNDYLIKIHLHNVRLLKEMNKSNNDFKKAIYLFRQVQQSMPSIASYIENHHHSEEIKGIIGITLLNKGAKKLGFEIFPLKSKVYRLFKLTSLLPICLLSKGQNNIMLSKEPLYLMMSKKHLIERYRSKV